MTADHPETSTHVCRVVEVLRQFLTGDACPVHMRNAYAADRVLRQHLLGLSESLAIVKVVPHPNRLMRILCLRLCELSQVGNVCPTRLLHENRLARVVSQCA